MRVLRVGGGKKTMLGQRQSSAFSLFSSFPFYSLLLTLHCLPCPFLLHDVGPGGEGEGKRERRKDKTGRETWARAVGGCLKMEKQCWICLRSYQFPSPEQRGEPRAGPLSRRTASQECCLALARDTKGKGEWAFLERLLCTGHWISALTFTCSFSFLQSSHK